MSRLLAGLAICSALAAEPARHTLTGEVLGPSHLLSGAAISARLPGRPVSVAEADLQPAGGFALDNLPAGQLELRVSAPGGNLLDVRMVGVPAGGPVVIHLPLSAAGKPAPAGGAVSWRALRQPLPAKAANALRKAEEAWNRGQLAGAGRFSDEALRRAPDCPGALFIKGLLALRDGSPESALPWLTRAVELEPERPDFLALLGSALYELGRTPEASVHARAAVRYDPSCPQAHYVLALIELDSRRNSPALLLHLERAAGGVSHAGLLLARLYASLGRTTDARAACDRLIERLPQSRAAAAARQLLASLR